MFSKTCSTASSKSNDGFKRFSSCDQRKSPWDEMAVLIRLSIYLFSPQIDNTENKEEQERKKRLKKRITAWVETGLTS